MSLQVSDGAGVRLVTLDRPEVLNAFDTPLYLAVAGVLNDAADETQAVAGKIAAGPLESLMATKRLLRAGRDDALRAARAREDAEFARLTGAAANREALASFVSKTEA